MAEYYISSNKCSIHQRKTKKHGTVYDVYFRITTKDDLVEHQKKLAGFSSKTLAKQAHLDFIQEYCERLPAHLKDKKKDPKKRDLTVGELLPEYLASLPNQNKESSIYDKRNLYDRFVLPELSKVKINDLTKEALYKWQDNLWTSINPKTNEHYSYSYLVRVRAYFASFLTWCEKRYSYKNNFSEVEKPRRRAPKKEMQFWTREEFEQFIQTVDNPTYRMMFTLSFFTGRRKGEILALTPQDFRKTSILFNKTYTRKTIDKTPYKITTTKNEKCDFTPICPALQRELAQYTGQSPFFFGGERPIHENTLTHAFEAYVKKAGVKRIRYHDLRHSFVSMLLHNGANLFVIADLIGDTVEQVMKTYGHMYESDKTRVISSIT